MPSPAIDPREPPMAQLSPTPPPREPLMSYGQDYQYAETLQNPYPEVVFSGVASTHGGATSASPATVGGGDGAQETSTADHDAPSSHRPDTVGSKEPVMHEDVWVEPRDALWYRSISSKKWATIIICTVGITGVVLAILGAMGKFSRTRFEPPTTTAPQTTSKTAADLSSSSSDPSPPADNSSNSISTITPSSTPTASSASSTPTGTNPPTINCSDPSTFLTSITWVGTEVGAYKGDFAQASSPSSCCSACETHSGGGCAGWLYNANTTFTPCTKIIVTADNHHDKDDTCPKGYAPTTSFSRDGSGDGGGVAGMGPCGRGMVVQEG